MTAWFVDIDWNKECDKLLVKDMWQKYCYIVYQAIDLFVQFGPSKNNKNPCWMNRAARSARKYKSRMWIRFRESQSYNELVEYRIAQNKAVKEYRKVKENLKEI